MPVNTTHPDYDAYLPYWQRMRDAAAGEDAIKQRGLAYLPVPSGMADSVHPEQSPAYRNYISRARYPEAVSPAIEGMSGLMGRKPPSVDLPESLDYLREQATADGLPLDALIDRMRQEVSTVGRYILLVDVDDEGNPYIATYPAESAINWRGDGDRLTLLVFEETVEDEAETPFERELVTQWRACRVEDGVYTVELYRQSKEDKEPRLVDTVEPRRAGGEPLDFVPAVIVGSRDLLPSPDSMPLLPVANKSLHYYRREADHALQLYMCAHGTTPFLFGVSQEEQPTTIGPSALWTAQASDAQAGYIEISGAGLEQSSQNLEAIRQEIVQATVQAMSESKRDAEAAETLRLRFQSQTAVLSSIAMSTAKGVERALRYCAYYAGAATEPAEESVTVEQSTGFITEEPDPAMLTALYDGYERGMLPFELISRYTRRTELHEYEDEEFLQRTAAGVAEAPEGG